jgi:hypothetical protein
MPTNAAAGPLVSISLSIEAFLHLPRYQELSKRRHGESAAAGLTLL